MSIQRVIIDAGQGPSAVLVDGLNVPKIVEVRQGPAGADGATGADGAPGPNEVTSATTSDGTADLYLETVSFNTSNGGPTQTGEISWDGTDGTLDAMLESSTKLAIGEDNLIRVRNTNTGTINKGDALVYVGTHGASGRLLVEKWVGANVTNLRTFLGFAACEMIPNADGYAQWFGKLDGIDADGGAENWQDGDIIYAVGGSSATITNVSPTGPDYVVAASVVNAGSGSSGILFVRPTFAINTDSAQFGTVELTGGTFTGDGDENVSSITLATTPSNLGDGKSIDWRWGSGGTLTAQIRTNATGSTEDELEFSASIVGSLTNCLTLGETSGTVGHGLRTSDVQATGSITGGDTLNLYGSGAPGDTDTAFAKFYHSPSGDLTISTEFSGTGDDGDIVLAPGSGDIDITGCRINFGSESVFESGSSLFLRAKAFSLQDRSSGNETLKFDVSGSFPDQGWVVTPSNSGYLQVNANLTASGTVQAGTYTYANLPAATTAGLRAFCSDSDTAAAGNFGGTFAGSGANFVPCYSDGTNWRIG